MWEQGSGTRVTTERGAVMKEVWNLCTFSSTQELHTWRSFVIISCQARQWQEVALAAEIPISCAHHLCSFLPNIKPSFSDSEPYGEGESKVLSGSQPNINPVTSPQADMRWYSKCYVMTLLYNALLSYVAGLFFSPLILRDFSVGRSRKLHKLLKHSGAQKKASIFHSHRKRQSEGSRSIS